MFTKLAVLPKGRRHCRSDLDKWWENLVAAIVGSAAELDVDAICTPAVVPSVFPDGYYDRLARVGDNLSTRLKGTSIAAIQTAIVSLKDVAQPGRALAIASILSRSPADRYYIVFVSDKEPRREVANPEEIKGAMRFIRCLKEAGISALVSFSSSDVILWKAAGAHSCATGKFFNLRRFTLNRFAESSSGGGQLPYWFEESLLAFLRQSDLLRVRERGMLSESSEANPYLRRIFDAIPAGNVWVGLSWRQYLWWFAQVESRLAAATDTAEALVTRADENWGKLEISPGRLYMEERQNDGSWVRQWRRILEEFPSFQ